MNNLPLHQSAGKTALLLAFVLCLSACVYVPVVDENTSSSTCQTYTKTLTINPIEMQENFPMGCNDESCLAVVVAVTAGSAIISSSIVLTGNTLHWLEYQGTCSDGYLAKAKRIFLESIGKLMPESAASEKTK